MKQHWKERYGKDGICDFTANYNFYFKWLLSKTCSCFFIKNLPETVDEFYVKCNLLCDGDVCFTDFNDKLYALNGAPGGQPDEYYRPSIYTIANPILGSKQVKDGVTGVIVYNSPLDAYITGGIYGLIAQTATLLADNIVSINCTQINTRVQAMVTADSEAQALAGELALKKMYAGQPYQVLRSDLIDKIGVNPINTASNASNLAQLIELHNYIIANYFQSIGIKSNDVKKKAHVLQEELDVQNDYLQISILEILTAWQEGFDKVNEMYGTDIHVELNPSLLDTLCSDDVPMGTATENIDTTEDTTETTEDTTEDEPQDVVEEEPEVQDVVEDTPQDAIEEIEQKQEIVEAMVDLINDNVEEVKDDVETNEETGDSEPVE